jgi:hypothetical protein
MSLLYQNTEYQVQHESHLSEGVGQFLDQIHRGNRGTRYQRPCTLDAARHLHRPGVISIETFYRIMALV